MCADVHWLKKTWGKETVTKGKSEKNENQSEESYQMKAEEMTESKTK